MSVEVVVPALGESVVAATVGEWLKQEGDAVQVGDALVSLETDKVDLDVTATQSGVLQSIEKQAGEDVQVGELLATIEPGEAGADGGGAASENGGAQATQAESAKASQAEQGEAEGAQSADGGQAPAGEETQDRESRVTPVARRMADEEGVDLAQVTGEGPGGRVTKQDVENYLAEQQREPEAEPAQPEERQPAPQAQTSPAGQPQRPEERVRMSRRRRTIAERLVEAQQTAAILTTFNEVDMSKVMDLRKRRREEFQKREEVGLGFMSFFVKATIGALKEFPHINAAIEGNEIVLKHYYDIGIAIGADEGLVVPVLRDADRKSFAQIERGINDFAEKVRDGTLALEDLRGGTFTITNGGVFGSLLSTPILNPPQVGILGMHKIEQRPVAVDGEVVVRPMMYVALSYDHRIVDGREAVQFLVALKRLIEDPEELLLSG